MAEGFRCSEIQDLRLYKVYAVLRALGARPCSELSLRKQAAMKVCEKGPSASNVEDPFKGIVGFWAGGGGGGSLFKDLVASPEYSWNPAQPRSKP